MVAETGLEPVIFGLWARRDTASLPRDIAISLIENGTTTENRTPVAWMKTTSPNP